MAAEQDDAKMRVVTTLRAGANPELWRDLEGVPRDQRSERMRLLATLGAQLARSGVVGVPMASGGAMVAPGMVPAEAGDQRDGQPASDGERVSGAMQGLFSGDGAFDTD